MPTHGSPECMVSAGSMAHQNEGLELLDRRVELYRTFVELAEKGYRSLVASGVDGAEIDVAAIL